MNHPALAEGRVAVVTGAASGIGLAAARRFAALGMRVCLVDVAGEDLARAGEEAARAAPTGNADVMVVVADVSSLEALGDLKEAVFARFGRTDLLMNNAVTRARGTGWGDYGEWRHSLAVNLWGVINGVQSFVPAMIAQGTPGLVVNVGSKQGITNPPGNTSYNVTKAAVKAYTEALEHELRTTEGCHVTAHLLVPGWTTTGEREHVPGAWLPDQVVGVLLEALGRGEFYILCPDGEVTAEMDRQRILWAAGDIVENRPPLSRWHPDFEGDFTAYCAEIGTPRAGK